MKNFVGFCFLIYELTDLLPAMEHRVTVSTTELNAIKFVAICCLKLADNTQKYVATHSHCINDCNRLKERVNSSSFCCFFSCFQDKDEAK